MRSDGSQDRQRSGLPETPRRNETRSRFDDQGNGRLQPVYLAADRTAELCRAQRRIHSGGATNRNVTNLESAYNRTRGRDFDRQEGLRSGIAVGGQAPTRGVAIRGIRSGVNDDGRSLPDETTARILGRRDQRYRMTTPRSTRGTRRGCYRSVLVIRSHRERCIIRSKMPIAHLAIAGRTGGVMIHQQVIAATGTHHLCPADAHTAKQRQHRDDAECSRSMRKRESHGLDEERPRAAEKAVG